MKYAALIDGGSIKRKLGSQAELMSLAHVRRFGDNLVIAEDGDVIRTATAVKSNPGTLVGGWVTDGASNGVLLVIYADGTFMFAETQSRLPGPSSGQERGCYTISGAEITFNIEAACKPDGSAAKDLNRPCRIFGNGI